MIACENLFRKEKFISIVVIGQIYSESFYVVEFPPPPFCFNYSLDFKTMYTKAR